MYHSSNRCQSDHEKINSNSTNKPNSINKPNSNKHPEYIHLKCYLPTTKAIPRTHESIQRDAAEANLLKTPVFILIQKLYLLGKWGENKLHTS